MMAIHAGDRYDNHINSVGWHAHAALVRMLCGNRCILFPILRSVECHHLHYRNLGHETPWLDTVPLSLPAHLLVHVWPFWHLAPLHLFVNIALRLLMLPAILLAPIALLTGRLYPVVWAVGMFLACRYVSDHGVVGTWNALLQMAFAMQRWCGLG